MKIALIQQHATKDREANIRRGADAMRTAARAGAELIVFPELSFTRFFPQSKRAPEISPHAETIPGPTTDLFSRLARALGVVAVINLYEQEGTRFYDSSPVLDADGTLLGITRMAHIIDAQYFYETDYYHPGDHGIEVYSTKVCRLGVAICYDRHFPEYMRGLALKGAELVVVPQAGSVGEWPDGVFQAEMQIAGFQNGYFTALANRVGQEEFLTFAGESFVTDPMGKVIAQAPAAQDHILYAGLDFGLIERCSARRHFLRDRRPDHFYRSDR
jgi:N-carbamoylputrescine amidase